MSGSGQMNCRMLDIVCEARNSDSGSVGSGAGRAATSGLSGSAKTSFGSDAGGMPEMSGTGWSSRHRPIGGDQHELVDAVRARRRQLGGDHAAERVADDRRPLDPERVEQLVVVEHEVPQVLDVLEPLRVAGARVLGRDDVVVVRQGVEQRVPEQAAGAVDVQQRIAGAGLEHADLEPSVAELDEGFVGLGHVTPLPPANRPGHPGARPAATTGAPSPRRPRASRCSA